MKQQKKTFIVSTEITISSYAYYHSWLINTFNQGYAEILLKQHIENLYKDQLYEYGICGVFEIDAKDIEIIRNFLPVL
ncbi:MAG TPA: hypothetical protein PLS49_01885 [Candidatus Woesebacteria bacterium]|nr:hypothetical protein [Candidatus Woesebacteria bacterium]